MASDLPRDIGGDPRRDSANFVSVDSGATPNRSDRPMEQRCRVSKWGELGVGTRLADSRAPIPEIPALGLSRRALRPAGRRPRSIESFGKMEENEENPQGRSRGEPDQLGLV